MEMTKRTLDTFGGIGSILCSLVCIWFAMGHHDGESMRTVWFGFACLLGLNGIVMIVWAQRSQVKAAHAGH